MRLAIAYGEGYKSLTANVIASASRDPSDLCPMDSPQPSLLAL